MQKGELSTLQRSPKAEYKLPTAFFPKTYTESPSCFFPKLLSLLLILLCVLQISEEITGFDLIQGDGSCSEAILDYLCDRQLQETESHSLYARIDADVNFLEWVGDNFDESLANHISDLYK